MQPGPATERPHRLTQLRLDERVDDDRAASSHAVDGELEVGSRLDARVADLAKLLLRELRLERLDESLRGLARRVGHGVQFDRVHASQGDAVTSAGSLPRRATPSSSAARATAAATAVTTSRLKTLGTM